MGDGEHERPTSGPASRPATDAGRRLVLRLYVAGSSTNSSAAVSNLRAFCERELGERCELEVIDVLREPSRAERAGIIATPTLVKEAPNGPVSIFGDLADKRQLRSLLGAQ